MNVTAQEFRDAAAQKARIHAQLLRDFCGSHFTMRGEYERDAALFLAAAEHAEQLDVCRTGNTVLVGTIETQHEQVATLTARVADLEARITEAHELDYRRVQHIRELSTLITAWEAKAAK